MKKAYIGIIAACLPALAAAQSAIDGQQISQPDFKGTARYMSMGGAFTALGGDLSTLGQNPAGVGIYRSSEIGVTLDLDLQHTSTSPQSMEFPSKNSQTKVYCNNFGYIGATNLDGALRTLNWGVSYNRAASFDRVYRGYVPVAQTSLTNYVANYTTNAGYVTDDMDFNEKTGYDPYLDSSIDWLSILSYSSFLINTPAPDVKNQYLGLYRNGTVSDALFNVRENGYVDEYNITVGGNVENTVYWGLTIGVTDLNYTRQTVYSESLEGANIYDTSTGGIANGDAQYWLTNRKYIKGSGFNLKLGVILKPVNEFRIGLAVHTPTWYSLQQGYDGVVDYDYYNPALPADEQINSSGNDPECTDYADFNWHYSSPWKLMAGVAAVLGQKAILSLDYEFDGYPNQRVSVPTGYGNYEPDQVVNQDFKDYFRGASTLRVGLEYRVTPQLSLRAGYNVTASYVKADAADGNIEVFTSGTDPSYSFDKTIQHFCLGLGYKYKSWYIDAAYVYKNRESRYHAFTNWDGNIAPQTKLSDNNSSIILSTGFRF